MGRGYSNREMSARYAKQMPEDREYPKEQAEKAVARFSLDGCLDGKAVKRLPRAPEDSQGLPAHAR